MADVTISSLPLGTPTGGNVIPYSTGSNTLGVPVSAIFHNAGNIGIGTASPRNKLDVNGTIFVAGGNQIQITGNSVTTGLQLIGEDAAASLIGTMSLQALMFRTHSIERMRIDANGNVGIGTTTPQAKLDVNGNMINNNLPMYGVRAWVRFSGVNDVNGTPSAALTDRQIFASGNVTRVNRWALGNYDIYLTTPFANTNYSVVANIHHAQGATTDVHIDAYAHTAGVVRTWCSYQPGTISYDPIGVDVWVIG